MIYVDVFREWLEEQGFVKKTIRGHVSNVELFLLTYIQTYNEHESWF